VVEEEELVVLMLTLPPTAAAGAILVVVVLLGRLVRPLQMVAFINCYINSTMTLLKPLLRGIASIFFARATS